MLPNHPSNDLPQLRDFLGKHLLDSVIPFWFQHAVDDAGGLNTCIRDDGSLINRDKYLWSQWRAVWVYSKLYNQIEKKQQWLDLAEHIYDFASSYGWDEDFGGWRLQLAYDGSVLQGCDSCYVDAFAIYGLTEFAKASGREEPLALARKTADNALRRLALPHDKIPHAPYPIPPNARVHGVPMIFGLIIWELGCLLEEPRYKDAALAMSDDIFNNFVRPERNLLLERIGADNSEYPAPLGTAVVPGHVIEDMWFQIHIAGSVGDSERVQEACQLLKRHVEIGWDKKHGGLLLAVDANGANEVGWEFHSTKLWWPHTEALYGLLLAYEQTRDREYLDWYDQIHQYSFDHFPDPKHGEWIQKLDRAGKPITDVVCLPVKDPFHLPRALILSLEVLDRLNAVPLTNK
ncbi:AGE family epimerase/isomerase [Adhaeretor mobilis]|uniref:Cellobiose 2-epimerase n=1 Tax=Adhaeretor mobilis TaxID=1930276 RepID=A0A517MW75_9BACT|nr:AGE family epimerase/isomerase [Adhaeretor mobilis]QDS99130.1 Cellobiose 2-epimerase [Adhaeretor mobilis]